MPALCKEAFIQDLKRGEWLSGLLTSTRHILQLPAIDSRW